MTPDADALPEDPVLLQAMVLGLRAQIAGIEAANRAYEALVQALKVTIARLKKQRFGASSEKIEREIEQLELALESLETARAAADPTPQEDAPETDDVIAGDRHGRVNDRSGVSVVRAQHGGATADLHPGLAEGEATWVDALRPVTHDQ